MAQGRSSIFILAGLLSAALVVAPAQAGEPVQLLPASMQMRSDTWSRSATNDTALVVANVGHVASILGVQCDRSDPRSRKLILAARFPKQPVDDQRAGWNLRPDNLQIMIESQSARSEFIAAIEERGGLLNGWGNDAAAAYLTPEQFALLRSARSISILAQGQELSFTGTGSQAAIDALDCVTSAPPRARRLIPQSAPRAAATIRMAWRFASLTTTSQHPARHRYTAMAATLGFAESPLASFKLEIGCHASRLFAVFANGSAANMVAGSDNVDAVKFMNSVTKKTNVAEIYKSGRMTAIFPVEPGPSGNGHPLSAADLGALMDFDAIRISAIGGGRTIEFSGSGGPQAIAALAEACGSPRSQTFPAAR